MMYMGMPRWEKADIENLTEELFSQVLPLIRFHEFSGAPPQNLFRTLRQEISDFMMDLAPAGTKAFINQVSGLLKPKYGFVRSARKGVGLRDWYDQSPVTSYSREELFRIWKESISFSGSDHGFKIKGKVRVHIFRTMLEKAGGWVPKSWFYTAFMEMGGYSIMNVTGSRTDEMDYLNSRRPDSFSDLDRIREAKILNGELWKSVLEKTLAMFSGKARVIFFRLLLCEDNQVEAARKAGTEPQYAHKILKRIQKEFAALLPMEAIEMAAFKSFFQEYLDHLEKGEPS